MREAATICPRPCKLTFDLLTLKVVPESHVTWATSVPVSVFLGLSDLDLGPMYATDRKTSSDVRRASSLNSSALWGRDIITLRDRGCVSGGLAVSGCFWFVLRRRRRSPFDLQSRRVFDAISAADRQHQSSVTSNLWCSVDQSWRSLRLYRTLHSASPQPVGQSVGQSPGREQSRLLGTVFASRGGTLHVQRPFVFRHSLCHTCLL